MIYGSRTFLLNPLAHNDLHQAHIKIQSRHTSIFVEFLCNQDIAKYVSGKKYFLVFANMV